MKHLLVPILVITFLACNSKTEKSENKKDSTNNKTEKTSDKTGKFKTNTERIIDSINNNPGNYQLKPDEAIFSSLPNFENIFGKNYKIWTPSEKDIEISEVLLDDAFNDQKRGTVNRVLNKKPEDYNKQFGGAIDSTGDKYVWINCFCKAEAKNFTNWKNEIVFVNDGGNCFLNVIINLTQNKYTAFYVNGKG